MKKSVMNMRIFCVAVGLMTPGAWAQVPIFKLVVTEVYEVNPDGTYTAKCGEANCPTQDLLPGIALPGDLINIEVTVEGWDASTESGRCSNPVGEACSISAQDCALFHCSGVVSEHECADDPCFVGDTCDRDTCEKAPLLGTFQWTIDSSTYSNGGTNPGLAPAQLPCAAVEDCRCVYTAIPNPPPPEFPFNDCADFAALNEDFCTCSQAACDESVCGPEAAAYVDSSLISNYVFFGHNAVIAIDLGSQGLDYVFAASSLDARFGGVPEELFKCNAGARPICNRDVDCPEGTCELVARSPYYLGTILLEATGESCGLFTVDLVQDQIGNVPIATFLNDGNAAGLPTPIVEALIIDLGFGVPCDDGDPCTEDDVDCGGSCAGAPIVCGPDEVCVNGVCQSDCGVFDLTGVTWADTDPLAEDPFDRPGNCAIDAREPHGINDQGAGNGWDRLVLQYSCDPTALALNWVLLDFILETDPPEFPPPFIIGINPDASDQTVTLSLSRSISPALYTCITRIPFPRNTWCAGYLPADASQDGLSAAGDINALINAINLVPGLELPMYATDINRSGVTTGTDILRLIDLLNGAGDFDVWIARSLPDCPSAP